MEIQGINLVANMSGIEYKTNALNANEFQKLFDKLTGGEIAQEIKDNYDVTLNVGSIGNINTLLNTYDIRCKNYVCISPETLAKMEDNPELKKKIMSSIEEFCSPQEQAKINSLAPPVKSAGMIVYPDGDTLYWLESYPNDLADENKKKIIVSDHDMNNTYSLYANMEPNSMLSDIESAMQILGTAYKREEL